MSTPLSLEEQVIVALRRITRAIDLHSRDLLQDVGLTAPQLAALQAIGRLQPVTISALARAIHLSQATLTGILSRLETRQLVSRSRSGSDRRTVTVQLTEAGRTVIETAPSLLQNRFRHELCRLEEWEQTQMLATLQRIASMMEPGGTEIRSDPPMSAPLIENVAAFDSNHEVPIAELDSRSTFGMQFAPIDEQSMCAPINAQIGDAAS